MVYRYKRKPVYRRKKRVYRRKGLVKASLLNRRMVSYSPSKGFIKISRKLPEIYIRNTLTAGLVQVNGDYSGSQACVALGTPIADSVGGSYSVPFSMKFRLDQLINSTDITNLADQYKITYAVIRLTYQSTSSNVGSNTIMPNLTWVQDHDDATLPASINELREHMGAKFRTFGFNKICKIGLRPRVQDTVGGSGGVVTNAVVGKPMWCNSSFPGVEHFGIKGILSNVFLPALPATLTSFKVDVTLFVSAKDIQ